LADAPFESAQGFQDRFEIESSIRHGGRCQKFWAASSIPSKHLILGYGQNVPPWKRQKSGVASPKDYAVLTSNSCHLYTVVGSATSGFFENADRSVTSLSMAGGPPRHSPA